MRAYRFLAVCFKTITFTAHVSSFHICTSVLRNSIDAKHSPFSSPFAIHSHTIQHSLKTSARFDRISFIRASSTASGAQSQSLRTFRILIADSISSDAIEILKSSGHHVLSSPDLDAATLPDAVANFEPHIIIVRSTRVTAAAINSCGSLEVS
jgi:hypothetical protein